MKLTDCPHTPHILRITFDAGFDQMTVYQLCVNCKQMPFFSDFVISEEILSEENNVAEAKFRDTTSADSSQVEMIT